MSEPLHAETPSPDDPTANGPAQHPSRASQSDFDVALALAGIRRDARTDRGRMRSVSIPDRGFGSPRGPGWRTRRRQAWLTGAHGQATLLSAHRSSQDQAPGPAPAA